MGSLRSTPPSERFQLRGVHHLEERVAGHSTLNDNPEPFLAMRLTNGSACTDESGANLGKRRETELRLLCRPGVVLDVDAVSEPETCQYVAWLHTAVVCHHPLLAQSARLRDSRFAPSLVWTCSGEANRR
jgi:hypothetical protein